MSGFAMFAGGCVVVAYLIYEPNRLVAIAFAGIALCLILRDLVQAGAEDPAKRREEREL